MYVKAVGDPRITFTLLLNTFDYLARAVTLCHDLNILRWDMMLGLR